MWQTLIGSLIALILAGLLVWHALRNSARQRAEHIRLFAEARAVLEDAETRTGDTAGVFLLVGSYNGHAVQVKVLADTLAVRKLPSLWMMVTLPEPLPIASTLDLMMRPAAATSFSNFDHLAYTIETPPRFPDHLVIRSDSPQPALPIDLVWRHVGVLRQPYGKELLISPKGLRFVVLLAEADRARYGVLRQADFGDAAVSADVLRSLLENLIDLRQDITAWHKG